MMKNLITLLMRISVWTILDKKVIDESECLFARKFDEIIDEEIIKYIISKVK